MKNRLRLAVFRSNKALYAQIVDDVKGETLVAASEKDLKKVAKLKRPLFRPTSTLQPCHFATFQLIRLGDTGIEPMTSCTSNRRSPS